MQTRVSMVVNTQLLNFHIHFKSNAKIRKTLFDPKNVYEHPIRMSFLQIPVTDFTRAIQVEKIL